jgi:hypothetical protein
VVLSHGARGEPSEGNRGAKRYACRRIAAPRHGFCIGAKGMEARDRLTLSVQHRPFVVGIKTKEGR